ncbi:MAG TPA: TonB-dependent receptor [Pyrinomonadaceae bacterium]|nr:TonB-dependent receptor [Pyrinomonadaceae bacterium]
MRRNLMNYIRILFCGLMVLGSAQVVVAQFKAGVQGTVTDSSGAVVSNATVTITNTETSQSQTTVASDDGFYRFNGLAPGRYNIAVTQTNFKQKVIENFSVSGETLQGLDVVLEAGGISETVTVSDESQPLLRTEDANIDNTITRAEVLRLPQIGRDPYELARLTPGVFGNGARSGSGAAAGLPNSPGPGGSNSSIFQTENQVPISANGQRVSANSFQIDGVSVNSQTNGGGAIITPSQEAVKEVTISSSSYSAEDGRNSGANIKVVSQNGTNDYHGSGFFKYNGAELNAFNKFPGSPQRVENRQRQFGGSFGGPLPFLNFGEGGPFATSGKDKLFFFFAYEGLRTGSNNTFESYVETAQYRNLVRTLRPNGVTAQVFRTPGIEPRIASVLPTTCAQAGFGADRCRAVNGGLDLGSLTRSLGQYVPFSAPTGGGFDGIPDVQLVRLFNPNSFQGNQFFTRVDLNATSKDNFAVSTFFTPTINTGADAGGRSRQIGDIISDRLNFSTALIYNRTISAAMFNQARFNYSGFSFNEVESNPNANFGIPRIEVEGLPFDRIRFGAPRGENTPGILSEKSVEFSDTFNWIVGNHALRFGTQLRFDFNDTSIVGGARPIFSFVGLFNLANDTPIFEGINADPTTGAPADAARDYKTNDYAFFVQDDWKVKPNLTLNLGLRYEFFPPIKDKLNRQSNIVFGPNGLVDSRVEVVDQFFKPDKNNFGPQIGFAYSPGFLKEKGVIRGGFGIGYNRIPSVVFINSRGNPPFFSRFGICCGTAGPAGGDGFGTPFVDGQILYALGSSNSPNSFPANPRLGGGINPATGAPFNGSVEIYGSTEEQPNAQSFRYSLEGQYQLPLNLTATVGYQGSRNKNLIRLVNQNFIFERTNPAFNAVFLPTPDVKSNYNALLATLERRFANGFQVQANYRFSKSLDNLSNEGPGFVTNQTFPVDNDSEYGPSDFDVTHNFNLFGLYDLPFFRNRNDLAGTFLGGFQVSGILTWHTGFPFTPVVGGPGVRSASGAEFGPFRPVAFRGGNGTDTSNSTFLNGNGNFTGSFIPGANCINTSGGCNTIFVTRLNRNAAGDATFLLNPPGIGRNGFRGPRYFNLDLSLSKRFNLPKGLQFGENSGLDLRVNLFNALNNLNLTPFGFASDSTRINNGDQPNFNFGRATSGLAGRVVELQVRFSF